MKPSTPIVDMAGLARYIGSDACQNIVVLTGAGVSVASGIPDFRSVGGMYDTLQPDLITATPAQRDSMRQDPTNVVTYEMFQQTQFPYMEVHRPFILGTQQQKWKATLTHRFIELLHSKCGKLTRLFTQNIDGLDYQCTNIPSNKIVPVHGTIGQASCEGCGAQADFDEFCEEVRANIKDIYTTTQSSKTSDSSTINEIVTVQSSTTNAPLQSTEILCKSCKKPLVKPRTVLFGRSLPETFFNCIDIDLIKADLLLIFGTSLVVSPANSIVTMVPTNTVRVVVNREPVGAELGIGCNNDGFGRDFFASGDCDEISVGLLTQLGWLDDIDETTLPEKSATILLKARRDTAYTQWF